MDNILPSLFNKEMERYESQFSTSTLLSKLQWLSLYSWKVTGCCFQKLPGTLQQLWNQHSFVSLIPFKWYTICSWGLISNERVELLPLFLKLWWGYQNNLSPLVEEIIQFQRLVNILTKEAAVHKIWLFILFLKAVIDLHGICDNKPDRTRISSACPNIASQFINQVFTIFLAQII